MNSGIICFETEWEITTRGNRRSLNTEPLLRFMEECYGIPYLYRKIATRGELEYYLRKICARRYDKYGIIYFCTHGQTHGLILEGEKEPLSLDELISMGGDVFQGRIVHFSSCRTLLGSQDAIDKFKNDTGAKSVSGYARSVDTVLSAIHDIALFRACQEKVQIPAIFRELHDLYEGLQKKLAFRTHTY